jgi:hypothetical protein
MECVNLWRIMPSELHKSVLFMIEMQDLTNICQTDIQTSTICSNDNFWHEYVVHNYDPATYGATKWDKLVFANHNLTSNYKLKIGRQWRLHYHKASKLLLTFFL